MRVQATLEHSACHWFVFKFPFGILFLGSAFRFCFQVPFLAWPGQGHLRTWPVSAQVSESRKSKVEKPSGQPWPLPPPWPWPRPRPGPGQVGPWLPCLAQTTAWQAMAGQWLAMGMAWSRPARCLAGLANHGHGLGQDHGLATAMALAMPVTMAMATSMVTALASAGL